MKMHFIMLFGVLYYNPWDILGGKKSLHSCCVNLKTSQILSSTQNVIHYTLSSKKP